MSVYTRLLPILDEILSYTTEKQVRVRDRYAATLYYLLCILILTCALMRGTEP